MRVLLFGVVLGGLLGVCSYWLLGQTGLLTPPQQLVLAIVIGLSLSGLVWSFGLVRWVARVFDRRAARRRAWSEDVDEPMEPMPDPMEDLDVMASVPADLSEITDVRDAISDPIEEAEVHYDEQTGTVDDAWLQSVEVPTPAPAPEPVEPPEPHRYGGYDDEEDADDNTTQLVSRAELKALARALLEGNGAAPDPVVHLGAAEVERLLEQASIATEVGRFDDALDLYSQVIDGAEDPRAYLGRGRVYLDHSDFNRAMSDFAMAEELMPGAPEPLVAMGDLYFGRKDYVQSIEYLTLALGSQPDNAMALTRRGMSWYYRKEYEQALVDLQRAAELDPDIPMLESYLARAERRVRGMPTAPPERRRR